MKLPKSLHGKVLMKERKTFYSPYSQRISILRRYVFDRRFKEASYVLNACWEARWNHPFYKGE